MKALPGDMLHPYGRCMCCGEGRCDWCRKTLEAELREGRLSPVEREELRLTCGIAAGLHALDDLCTFEEAHAGPCSHGVPSMRCPFVAVVGTASGCRCWNEDGHEGPHEMFKELAR